jgi:hypothetical protein
VSSQTQPLYQAVIPGTPLVENQTTPTDVDLTSKAILYAYLVSGQEIRDAVEAEVGAFAETDALTALRRTTQPGGDEAFAGRYELPILDIVGFSTDPERAELISRTATAIFLERVLAEQTASALPEPDRVILTPLDQKPAVPGEGSNPAIPIVVAFLGVFLLFVAIAFILAGAKSSRARKRAAQESVASAAPLVVGADDTFEPGTNGLELHRSRARQSSASSVEPEGDSAEDADAPAPAYTS